MQDKHTSPTHGSGCGCAECTCGKRNRFFRGKRMKADDFAIEQAYGIERRRILNRSILGSGIVNGFAMAKEKSEVGPGLAIDRHGREIVLTMKTELVAANLFLVERGASGCRTLPIDQASPKGHYLLSVHYAERRLGDAKLPDSCGCETAEKNYVCETAVFSLVEVGERCSCGERPCRWTCRCDVTDACGERTERIPDKDAQASKTDDVSPPSAEDVERSHEHDGRHEPDDSHTNRGGRGPHACLCHRLMETPVDCTHPALCDWNGSFVDPADGVALACVDITQTGDECRPVEIVVWDPCGPRHFVKSNEILYDFIRGCDLTHIAWISWHHWHRQRHPMSWSQFESLFHASDGWTAFAVRFSGPVLKDTIRFDSVVMRAVTIEQATDWRVTRRVPIARLDLTPHGKVPPGTTDQLRIYVPGDWIGDEIEKERSSWLTDRGFEIEIEIFGDGILDCHHQPIDADAIGVEPTPSGNGTPGGTYRSAFRVQPKPRRRESAA